MMPEIYGASMAADASRMLRRAGETSEIRIRPGTWLSQRQAPESLQIKVPLKQSGTYRRLTISAFDAIMFSVVFENHSICFNFLTRKSFIRLMW